MTDVDFVINVFERTYREVLRSGCIRERTTQHRFAFRRIVVLINNVDDRDAALAMAEQLRAGGEITDIHFVADRLEDALQAAGLTRADIAQTLHYTDCSLVAVFLQGSPYLLYCDTDVWLTEPQDWITPSLALMQQDARVAVTNPEWIPSTLQRELRERSDDFALGYGFSDQLYLLRREEFALPIYRCSTPISWRYPLSYQSPVFEQRVDAYMRVHHRLRGTYMGVQYRHEGAEGACYRRMTTAERLKKRAQTAAMWVANLFPGQDPRFHI